MQIKLWTRFTINGFQTINPGLIRRRDREADLFDNGRYLRRHAARPSAQWLLAKLVRGAVQLRN
jgi:hypothetical protein